MTYILGTSANTLVDEQLKYIDELWGLLKDNLQKAQHKMKHFADQKRTEGHFAVRD